MFPEFGYFLKKKTKKKTFRLKSMFFFFQLFRSSLSLKPRQTGNVFCIKVVSRGCCFFFPCHDFIKIDSNENSGVECKSY